MRERLTIDESRPNFSDMAFTASSRKGGEKGAKTIAEIAFDRLHETHTPCCLGVGSPWKLDSAARCSNGGGRSAGFPSHTRTPIAFLALQCPDARRFPAGTSRLDRRSSPSPRLLSDQGRAG